MSNDTENLILREIDNFRNEINNTFADFRLENKEAHERLEAHAIKTNGNVKRNTEWRLKNHHLPKIVYGAVVIVLSAFLSGVVILIWK